MFERKLIVPMEHFDSQRYRDAVEFLSNIGFLEWNLAATVARDIVSALDYLPRGERRGAEDIYQGIDYTDLEMFYNDWRDTLERQGVAPSAGLEDFVSAYESAYVSLYIYLERYFISQSDVHFNGYRAYSVDLAEPSGNTLVFNIRWEQAEPLARCSNEGNTMDVTFEESCQGPISQLLDQWSRLISPEH